MQVEEDEEARTERYRFLADTLSQSAFAEDQLAAALIQGSTVLRPGANELEAAVVERRRNNLQSALAADPTHPLVLWQVADDCRRGRGGAAP